MKYLNSLHAAKLKYTTNFIFLFALQVIHVNSKLLVFSYETPMLISRLNLNLVQIGLKRGISVVGGRALYTVEF